MSPNGMKLGKKCEIFTNVEKIVLHGFTWFNVSTSIMWTLIFIPFRDSTSLRHFLNSVRLLYFYKVFVCIFGVLFRGLHCDVNVRKSISAIKPGAEMLKEKRSKRSKAPHD